MAKKQVGVTLRKPRPADVEQFVSAGGALEAAMVPSIEASPLVSTETGRPMREVTLYLPQELARKVALYCAERDRDVSNVVAEAMTSMIEPQETTIAPEPPAPEEPEWLKIPKVSLRAAMRLVRARLPIGF